MENQDVEELRAQDAALQTPPPLVKRVRIPRKTAKRAGSPTKRVQTETRRKVSVQTEGKKVPKFVKKLGWKALNGLQKDLVPNVPIIGRKVSEQIDKQIQKKINSISGSGSYMVNGQIKHAKGGPYGSSRGVLRTIRGQGDYTVSSNTIASRSTSTMGGEIVPQFTNVGRGMRVTHREYLGDISSSSSANTFNLTSYPINPGISTSFPWLSIIAQNFDQWCPNGVVYSFKSTSAEYNGSTQALGTVILATDYDITDPSYASKVEMENSEFCVSCKTSMSVLHPVECAKDERPIKTLKVRSTATPTDNKQWYDLGNFQIATTGIAGTSVNIGELWVTYDITFYKEQLYGSLLGLNQQQADFVLVAPAITTAYLGTSRTAGTANTFTPTLTGTTITFPATIGAGTFLVVYVAYGASTACTALNITATSGCTAVSGYLGSVTAIGLLPGTTAEFVMAVTFTISAPSAVITFSGGVIPLTPTGGSLTIIQINSSCNT